MHATFNKIEFDGKILGFGMKRAGAFFFFGTRHATREELYLRFPEFKFAFLKQVHGRTVVDADPEKTLEADAHFTSKTGLALVSQSADCTPILLASDEEVCAIHAGWRGMAQNIVASVHQTRPGFRPTVAAIGPHILKSSFEVGDDVARQLAAASPGGSDFSLAHSEVSKRFFDLASLAKEQLKTTFGPEIQIAEFLRDTKTDLEFHSYRRGKATSERQYSFVVLID